MRGDYTLAAEVLARALAQEGLRINHHLLPSATDLVSEPERCAVISKSLVVAMAHMQEDLRSLKAPLLQREPPPLQRLLDAVEREAQRVRCLPDAWLGALRPANELPRPARALELLARRWQLPTALVGGYWTDFTAASGELYTLSLARAKLTLLSELPDATLQQATWALLLLDPASAELIERDENGAEPSGAGGASFEEYLIFRRFAEAPTLEQQFRFLWRLYDRDGDGLLGWADLLAALQLQRWRHGWSEAYTYQWAEYVWGVVARRDRTTAYMGAITADELRDEHISRRATPMPSDALAALAERNDPERTLVALTMLSTLLTNAKRDAAKYGSIKSSSKALGSKVLECEGGVAALECISFRLQGDAYVFGASAEPPEDAAAALAVFEAARTALLQLGDDNVPDAAMAALKLVCIYAQNVVDAPDDASKRRVNAANKALQSRVLSASGGRSVELHTWSAPSKRWRLQGSMPIPSTAFEWSGGLRMDVDLGDGTVLPLEAAVANDALENEYQSAKRFIDDHPEDLDNNYLEEIARNIRTLAAPVMQTVQNLKAAMEAQN